MSESPGGGPIDGGRPDEEPTINEAGTPGFAVDGTDSFAVPGPADGLPPGDEIPDDLDPELAAGPRRVVMTLGVALVGLLIVILVGALGRSDGSASDDSLQSDDVDATTTVPDERDATGVVVIAPDDADTLLLLGGQSPTATMYDPYATSDDATLTSDPYGTDDLYGDDPYSTDDPYSSSDDYTFPTFPSYDDNTSSYFPRVVPRRTIPTVPRGATPRIVPAIPTTATTTPTPTTATTPPTETTATTTPSATPAATTSTTLVTTTTVAACLPTTTTSASSSTSSTSSTSTTSTSSTSSTTTTTNPASSTTESTTTTTLPFCTS